jgi:hypothetical protein
MGVKINLSDYLMGKSAAEVKSFLDNRQDDGQFSEFDTTDKIEIDSDELPGWLEEFGKYLVEKADQVGQGVNVEYIADPKRFKQAATQIFTNPAQAIDILKKNTPRNLHQHIDDFLVDMGDSVDDDVVYDETTLIGDFIGWAAQSDKFDHE